MISFSVVGLGYGDEGKGSVVDWLVREYGIPEVVRFNGGAQAAHHVVTADGRRHQFSQWGSGTFAGARTHIGAGMMIDPPCMFAEAEHLEQVGVAGPFSLLSVDANAIVTTPYHRALNRLREIARGDRRHGSCGMGIGETRADAMKGFAIRARDLRDAEELLTEARDRLRRQALALDVAGRPEADAILWDFDVWGPSGIADIYARAAENLLIEERHELPGDVVFEGAQGVLLDEDLGFYPYVTWARTTARVGRSLPRDLLARIPGYLVNLGVTRAYVTRHGPGPLVTESPWLTELVAAGDDNGPGEWQGPLRAGYPDMVALRYAVDAARDLHAMAVTCLDHVPPGGDGCWRVCDAYLRGGRAYRRIRSAKGLADSKRRTADLEASLPVYDGASYYAAELPGVITRATGVPVWLQSYGPRAEDKASLGLRALASNAPTMGERLWPAI